MKSVDRVREYLQQHGVETRVQELNASTRTAQLAAEAVGAPLGAIVKSLVMMADDHLILALVAGDRRADAAKIARLLGAKATRMANGDEVRTRTGYAIGGVPPIAHENHIETLIDRTLLRFEKVWAAAGAPNALFEIEIKKLVELAQGRVEEIVES